MGLDARGGISVAELIAYIPLFAVSVILVLRHGFRKTGWIYLILLSIMRVIGAVTHIYAEEHTSASNTVHIVYSIMESTGISPLLLAALGFLGTVKEFGFEKDHMLTQLTRGMGILVHVALALSIAGGVDVGDDDSPSKVKSGVNLRHIGVALFIVDFILTVLVTLYLWINRLRVAKHRRTLLIAVAASMPFLLVRIIYTICSAWAPTGIPGVDSGYASLSAFNSTTGNVAVYLIMSVIMEFIVILIYVSVGLATPLQKDYASAGWGEDAEATRMSPPPNAYPAVGRPSGAYIPQY